MRADNIPKIIRDATVRAKRTARTEAAAREDAIIEQTFKVNNVKYFRNGKIATAYEPEDYYLNNLMKKGRKLY